MLKKRAEQQSINLKPAERNGRLVKKISVSRKKIFIICSTLMSTLIVGLVVANVVVGLNKGQESSEVAGGCNGGDEENSETAEEEEVEYGGVYNGEFVEELNKALIEAMTKDNYLARAIEIYQRYIDGATGEEQADLLYDRIMLVVQYDYEEKYGNLALDDASKVDEILQSSGSAVLMINVARKYGNDGMVNAYTAILKDREEASGMDIDQEVVG